ncbi:hypothetical protein [Kingella oralis]|uniref:hypothetical protein n=1 Tax=Kingella oralis TaxID=505 RepID=UPI0034E3D054
MDFALIFWLGRKLGWIQQTAPKPTRKQTIIGGLALLIVLVAVGLWCGKYANRCLTHTKVWGTDSFCTAPICAGLCSIPCYINDAAKSASTTDDAGFFKKTIKTYQIPSKS